MTLLINHAHKDPAMRELIQNRDFRIGLSHAINREEIIDLVYIGQGEPWQSAPRPESEFYNERLAKQYTEYDVDLANEHLDRAFPERDAQGFRVRPDGQRISLTIMVTEAVRPEHVDILELIQGYWRDVDVEMHMAIMDRALMFTRAEANEHDAMVWTGDGGMKDAFIDPTRYMTTRDWGSIWAGAWGRWFANPEDPLAIEPSEAAKRQMDLYDQIIGTASLEEQVDLFRQILDIAQEEFYVIGISLPTLSYGIVRNDFHNVPEIMPQSFQYPTPGPTNPEQYFRSEN